MINIDQCYYFQGAPDQAGQPLHSSVTLQYKMLAKPFSTNSKNKTKRRNSYENVKLNLNFIPKCQNENSRLNVKIISLKTASTNASWSGAESSRSSTDHVPVCQSLLDSGKMLGMRANLMTHSRHSSPTLLVCFSRSTLYLARDWGSQPQSGVVAVSAVVLSFRSHADHRCLIYEISRAVTRGDNDPAHIRARGAGLNQHTGAAGLSDLIIRLGGGHPNWSKLVTDDAQHRKSISELISIVINHFLYTHFHSKFMHRFTLHQFSNVLFIDRV